MSFYVGASSDESEPLLGQQLQSQVNYNNQSESSRRWIKSVVATICLSLAVVLEGFSYYCIVLGAVEGEHFRKLMEGEPVSPTIVGLIFKGSCFFLPVFAGTLADSVLGHFKTMLIGAGIYITGGFILIIMVYPCKSKGHEVLITLYIISLIILATGRALYRTTLTVFLVYQFNSLFGSNAVTWAFSWFYFCLYLGSLGASFVLAYTTDGLVETMAISVTIGPTVSILFVLVGYRFYVSKEQSDKKLLIRSLQIFITKFKNCLSGDRLLDSSQPSLQISRNGESLLSHNRDISSARQLGRILPLFGITIFFYMSYAELLSGFVSEANRLPPLIERANDAVTINIFTCVSLLVFIPVIYTVVQLLPSEHFSLLVKMGVGIIFMCVAMVTAGLMDTFREHIQSQWYLVPQCAFVAIAEIFTVVEGAAFAYSQSPSGLEGTVMGLFLCSDGVGSYLSTGFEALVNSNETDPWFPTSEHPGHLSCFFYILATLVALSFCIYVLAAKTYEYYKELPTRKEGNIAYSTSSVYYVNGSTHRVCSPDESGKP